MSAGPSLKVVSTFSAGYDHIATDELAKRNITLGSGTLHKNTGRNRHLADGLLILAAQSLTP